MYFLTVPPSDKVRSANEGSANAGWPLVAPIACSPKDEEGDEEDMVDYSSAIQLITDHCRTGRLPEAAEM